MGLEAFRRIQTGLEATRGTLVAADKKLYGSLTMTPEITYHRPMDERNSLAEFRRSVATAQRTTLRYEGDATYDQIVDFLSMALKGAITPTGPVVMSEADRLWTFTPNLTSKNVQDSFTFEYGDDTQEFECGFVVCENLELSIALGEVLGLRADLFGKLAAKATFTGSISEVAVTEIVANDVEIWIDGTYANLGTTLKATLLTGGSIRIATGLVPVKYADGSLDMSTVMEQRRHLEMDLDLAIGTDGITEYDAYIANTDRAIRIKFTGAAIVGSASQVYALTIDAFGRYTSAPELFGTRDGENIMRLSFSSHEDGSGNEMSVTVMNLTPSI